ncbi:sensor histidine kinase [Dyadobacter sandarakinus]|uniref:histidine kinase n=1 Tax=Dyadobacter sandarakinus TaxID=2747268 RepID=A0ABX7IAZ2_9BACT|nr:ATP-binding protein [Dyadobacter sandarakinus]QRR03289.1 PAS domain S-box protein [Dyadobacter sandarakinus]
MPVTEIPDNSYHRLLKRQLRKSLPEELAAHPGMQDFLLSVNQAYMEYQDDLGRVEHILEQSSSELFRANRELSRIAQEKTEEAAITSKRLQEVVASISEVLVQLDAGGHIIYLNNAWEQITGYTVAESTGRSLLSFPVSNASREVIDAMLAPGSGPVHNTIEIATTKGSRWLGISLRPQFSSAGEHIGYTGTFSDVTDRVRAERKLHSYMHDLEKINAELDQFAYVVSHDLKAPLRAINNLSEWIEEDISHLLEGETRDQFRLLRGRVYRMEAFINGILSYSRAGRIKTTKEKILVRSVVDDLCETFSTKQALAFTVEGDPELEIISEKITLIQILQNLISNGIKYNDKEEVKIAVGWTARGNWLEFYVSDNGPGISKEYHDRIFVIFQTLQARDEMESTGVGLAIVKKIVDEKGGTIRIESEMGKGTTFFFTWPVNETKAAEMIA